MTDNDIIKALECCSMSSYPACRQCPYHDDYTNRDCINKRNADIKDLINRQKAEIERLQKAKYIYSTIDYCADDLDKALKENGKLKTEIETLKGWERLIKAESHAPIIKKAKDEAITEFAERLKATPMRFHVEYVEYYDKPSTEKMVLFIDDNDIDQIAKEMKGEQ